MDGAMLRRLLIAAVKYLVNVAIVVDSVGRNLSPAKRALAATPIGPAALISARLDDLFVQRLQFSNKRVQTFYVVFVLCTVLQLP